MNDKGMNEWMNVMNEWMKEDKMIHINSRDTNWEITIKLH